MSLIFAQIATASPASEEYFPPVRHLVTLQHPESWEEVTMVISTETDSFCAVMREIKRTVSVLWLEDGLDYRRYRYYEAFQLSDPF